MKVDDIRRRRRDSQSLYIYLGGALLIVPISTFVKLSFVSTVKEHFSSPLGTPRGKLPNSTSGSIISKNKEQDDAKLIMLFFDVTTSGIVLSPLPVRVCLVRMILASVSQCSKFQLPYWEMGTGLILKQR